MPMRVVAGQPWSWMLLEHGDGLFLSVVCGSATLYVVNLRLTAAEAAAFRDRGDAFVAGLARDVAHQPDKYLDRSLGGFDDMAAVKEAVDGWRRQSPDS